MRRINVLLVDDQVLFVESLKGVLDLGYPQVKVVGIAQDGLEAIEKVRSTRPDVVLMDVRMAGLDGVQATGMIHEEFPNVHIIMVTTFDDDEYVQEAISRGAVGYVLKNTPVRDLVEYIGVVHEGAFLASPSIAEKIARKIGRATPEQTSGRSVPQWFESLTPREKEMLFYLAKGYDNKAIATRMHLAEQTTRNRISRIYTKMGVRDRANAVKVVLEANLGRSRTTDANNYLYLQDLQ